MMNQIYNSARKKRRNFEKFQEGNDIVNSILCIISSRVFTSKFGTVYNINCVSITFVLDRSVIRNYKRYL